MAMQVEFSRDSVIHPPPAVPMSWEWSQTCSMPSSSLAQPSGYWHSPYGQSQCGAVKGTQDSQGKSLDSLPSLGLAISFGGVECWTTPDYGQD